MPDGTIDNDTKLQWVVAMASYLGSQGLDWPDMAQETGLDKEYAALRDPILRQRQG